MRDYKWTFAAGEEKILNVGGNCLHFVKGSSPLIFNFDGSANSANFERSSGATLRFQQGFGKVTIRSTVAQNVTVSIGLGESYDRGVTEIGDVQVDTSVADILTAFDDVVIAANNNAQLLPASIGQREIRITVPEDALFPIRIGPQSISANKGGLIYAGVTEYITTNAAVYAFNTDPDNPVSVSILRLEKS